MANSARLNQTRNSASTGGAFPSFSPGFLLVDLAVVLTIAAAAAVFLWQYADFRKEAYTALGYGWAPVSLWGLAALAALRYRIRWLLRHLHWLLASAGVVVISVGLLAFFDADYGQLAFIGLGGRWGQALVGESLLWGSVRLAAIALVIPLTIAPRAFGRWYWRALAAAGRFLRAVGLAMVWLTRQGGRAGSAIFVRERRPNWLESIFHRFGQRLAGGAGAAASPKKPAAVSAGPQAMPATVDGEEETPAPLAPVQAKGSKWHLPPMDLLSPVEARATDEKLLQQMSAEIEHALADHGVNVEVADVKAGPRIARFGLMPGWVQKKGTGKDAPDAGERSRVRVQSIMAREKDLALAISAPSLRFEQVPGEALLGLEVPSPCPGKVTLSEVVDAQDFRRTAARGGLPVALGADASGAPVSVDLSALPHMMIAGATGSGKSVCINSIVASLLLTKPPDQLRLLMVDPKQVELTPFNGIPHLVTPVITEVDEVSPMLKGMLREMTRRYKSMAEIGVRNITGYNAKAPAPMPFLVLIVDELADLMLVGGFDIEQSLVRLAQLGRAAGIHLVLATQRPSVKVVTGLLKANIPSRVAFAVASQVDARVVMDTVGAEKLLGKGDMLLLTNDSPKPRRVQGALVVDEETEGIVGFWQKQKGPPLPEITLDEGDDEEEGDSPVDDGIYQKARELALRNPNLTSSLLERRLKIGGSRAAQVLEMLEDEGLTVSR